MSSARLSRDQYFLAMLDLVAARSTCKRRAVGCIITDVRGVVLATGYNGVPRGFDHCIDSPCAGAGDKPGDTSKCMAVHAEQNAILQCHSLSRAFTMYCSNLPCFVCAKMIANTNIKHVLCARSYADQTGLDVLKQVVGIRIRVISA